MKPAIVFAAATSLAVLLPAQSHAALISTHSPSLGAGPTAVAAADQFVPFGSAAATTNTSLALFDSVQGVLVGAHINVNGTITSQGDLDGFRLLPEIANGAGRGFGGATASGTGFADVVFGSPYASALDNSKSCTGSPFCGPNSALASAPLVLSSDIAADELGRYVLGGNAALTRAARSRSQAISTDPGDGYTSTVTWASTTLSIDFAYLLHGRASFSGANNAPVLDLDLGSVLQGSPGASLAFDFFNFASDAANTAGIDVDLIQGSGDTAALTTDLGPLSDLAPGAKRSFTAQLNSALVGNFAANYIIRVSDADIGVGRDLSAAVLRLRGRVVAGDPIPVDAPVSSAAAMSIAMLAALRPRRRLH